MRFRNKLLVLMVGLALVSNGVLVAITTYRSRSLLVEEISSKVLSIASPAARLIEAAEHESIQSIKDVDSPAYVKLEGLLRTIRDANRRDGRDPTRRDEIYVKFIYTLRPVPGKPDVYAYVVDAEERGSKDRSDIGDEYETKDPQSPPIPLDRDDIQIAEDDFGTFLSATSPIRDAAGNPIAVLGVDVDIKDVLARTRLLIYIGIGGMLIASGVAAALAVVLSRRVSRSLEALNTGVEKVAAGDLDARVPVDGNDEFATLGAVFNGMVPQLRDGLKLKESLALAMEVQQSLLPAGPPTVDGLEIAGHSIYCDETGGDYFDFLELSSVAPDTLAIVVGDVTGHGIAAALLMTTARALLRGRAGEGGSLATLITHMNRHLARDCQSGRFMTLYYLVIDASDRRLRWVSAGHDPAIVYNPATDVFIELAGADIPMGLDAEWEYQEFDRDGFIDGQVLVIGTDGIWESRDPKGKMFGKGALREIIRSHARRPCSEIAKAITDALLRFRQGRSQEDDVTLVVMKFVPRRAPVAAEQPPDPSPGAGADPPAPPLPPDSPVSPA